MAEFKNPNQQGAPQSNNSLFLIMIAVLLGLTAYNYFHAKHNPQTVSPSPATSPAQMAARQAAQSATTPSPTVAAVVNGQTVQIPAVAAVVAANEQTTVVENELYKITFSNKGAQATSWILKRYKDSYGKPLDLVHDQAALSVGYPLSLYTYDPALTANLAHVLYQPSATGQLAAPASLTFQYASGEYSVTKTFTFADSYVIHADTQVLHNGAPIRALLSWPGGLGDQENAIAYTGTQVDYSQAGKEKHDSIKDTHEGNTLSGGFDWAGTSDQYFASIFLPDSLADASVVTLHNEIVVPKANRHNGLGSGSPDTRKGASNENEDADLAAFYGRAVVCRDLGKLPKDAVCAPILGAAVGDLSGHTLTRLFAGPKAVGVLQNVHPTSASGGLSTATLEPLLDFGFFAIVGKPLFYALRFINQHVSSSWGWDIVWLTLLINLIILPLRLKTMVAGLKMQRIQPQIEAIKAKYKSPKMNDPKFNEMNAEVMAFQKDQGVNMFGGCVPTLIQMPLLLAFFGMLPKVVELRQAHWFWLPDLSSADPYHILPVLMMASQFLVQFYTPSPGVDPQQQKMMAFMMPAVSGVMTWNYASGLGLYWSVGNFISIATQMAMSRTSLGREMKEIATRRARKKAGLGNPGIRTIQGKAVRK